MVITIDGPVAAGKTTAAQQLAARLRFSLLDTGAIYRCVALQTLRQSLDWSHESAAALVAAELEIEFRTDGSSHQIFLNGIDVSEAIRAPEISRGASIVSALPGVRSELLEVQRAQAAKGNLIAEGRDTGTVVFPQAEYKFFLTATPEVRARRRFLELQTNGTEVEIGEVLAELEERDHRDSSRSVAPLIAAADAIAIDCSQMSAREVVAEMQHLISDQRPMTNS